MVTFILWILAIYLILYVMHCSGKVANGPGPRKHQAHARLIDKEYFRLHIGGAYAWMELDFGKTAHGEFVLLFGCTDRFVNWQWNKPQEGR